MRKKGFTLVELIITMVILGVLTGIGGVKYASYVEDARLTEIKSNCSLLEGVELQEQLKGRSIRGAEGVKTGKYATKEGIKDEVVVEKQYEIDESKLGSLGGKIRDIGEYYIGESGVVRYYGELKGEVKGKNSTDPTNPTDPGESEEPKAGDLVVQGDYEFKYKFQNGGAVWMSYPSGGWGVRVLDKTKTSYGDMPDTVNGYPVTSARYAYHGCSNMIKVPKLSNNLVVMMGTFINCSSLVDGSFQIPPGVNNLSSLYSGCTSLKKGIDIGDINVISGMYSNCSNLQGELNINTTIQLSELSYLSVFNNAVQSPNKLIIKGTASDEIKEALVATQTTGNISVWYPEPPYVGEPPKDGETVEIGDYEYGYNMYWYDSTRKWRTDTSQNGWGVRVRDKTKSSYEPIKTSIKGKPVTNMQSTFEGCKKLTTAPVIPGSVTNIVDTFHSCSNLTTTPVIPNGVTNMQRTFYDCSKLTTPPTIPSSVTNMGYTFHGCSKLTTAPIIPNSVTSMKYAFQSCTSLTTAPVIPSSVTNMDGTFDNCSNLTTAPTIPNSVTTMYGTFYDCSKLTTASTKIPNSVTNMGATFYGCKSLTTAPEIPNSVTNMVSTFAGCTSLTTAPVIPNSVKNMGSTFQNCSSLTTAPEIPSGVTSMDYTFYNCINLNGEITINANPTEYDRCFENAVLSSNNLIIKGDASNVTKTALKNTGNANIIIG